jgi:hypothetical protein
MVARTKKTGSTAGTSGVPALANSPAENSQLVEATKAVEEEQLEDND